MLSIDAISASSGAAYYLEVIGSGAEDYYMAVGEAPGRWLGRASVTFGLSGLVGREDFEAVLAGADPRTGQRVATWHKRSAYDLTLSAPKSVSVLWGTADGRVARAVRDAHDEAVDAAVAHIEAAACAVRRGRGGRLRSEGSGFVAAAFRHRTSREGDPQLHTHVVVANMTADGTGAWSSLFGHLLWRHAKAAGCIYQSVLRRRLSEQLGLAWGDDHKGWREVEGVPAKVRSEFSRRRAAIVRAMAAHGARSRHGAQVATLDTRPDKPTPVTEDDLRANWASRAALIGFSAETCLDRPRVVPPGSASDSELAHVLTEKEAAFEQRHVIAAVAASSRDGMLPNEIHERVASFLATPELVRLATGRWTTIEMLEIEREVLALADGGSTRCPRPAAVASALAERPSLSGEQREAVRRVTNGEMVSLIVGHAGAGKTFALDAARAAWQRDGHNAVGCSLAARAARQLTFGSGIESDTADRLLAELDDGRRRLSGASVIVVDEAGMLGSRRLARLARHVASADAKLVLVGDPRQLPEIDAGGLFTALAKRLGYVELRENRRQADPDEQQVAKDLRTGEIDKALGRLTRTGRVHTDTSIDALRDRMVRDWHVAIDRGTDVLMLALHRSDVADLNRRARARLLANDELGPVLMEIDDLELAVGDQVMTLRNNRRLGVVNGSVAKVIGADANGLVLRGRDGKTFAIPRPYIERGHLTHAYASTVHKAQGLTCDVALLLGDDTLFAEAGYTGMTRGRERNHIYVMRGEGDDGLDALRRSLQRSGAKQTATEQLGLTHG